MPPPRVSACSAGLRPRALPSDWLSDQGSPLLHSSTGWGHGPRGHGVTGDTWPLVPVTLSHPRELGQGASVQGVGSEVWREADGVGRSSSGHRALPALPQEGRKVSLPIPHSRQKSLPSFLLFSEDLTQDLAPPIALPPHW